MAKQIINIGTTANDDTGDTPRVAGGIINDNFDEVYTALEDLPLSAGMLKAPGYTDHADGSITILAGDANLYSSADFTDGLALYAIASDTFTLTDGVTNYVVADYNSGSPIYANITNVDLINTSTIIPVYTIFRNGNVLTLLDWDGLGSGLANRLHFRLVKTERFRHESGVALSEKNTRELAATSGIIWIGGNRISLDAADSATDSFSFFYHVSGAWTQNDSLTQYNNSQYDDGTDLQTIGTAKYIVNWVFRHAASSGHLCFVLGNGNYNLAEALDSAMPALPPVFLTQMIYVGRVIVLKNASAATQIQGAFDTTVPGGISIQQHNDLAGLNAGDYQHLTAAEKADMYSKDNILDTVSQTAGVPTGGVIESGSNANGEYVRFADGLQICTNSNAAITTNPAAFVGTVTDIDSSKLRIGRWF